MGRMAIFLGHGSSAEGGVLRLLEVVGGDVVSPASVSDIQENCDTRHSESQVAFRCLVDVLEF